MDDAELLAHNELSNNVFQKENAFRMNKELHSFTVGQQSHHEVDGGHTEIRITHRETRFTSSPVSGCTAVHNRLCLRHCELSVWNQARIFSEPKASTETSVCCAVKEKVCWIPDHVHESPQFILWLTWLELQSNPNLLEKQQCDNVNNSNPNSRRAGLTFFP